MRYCEDGKVTENVVRAVVYIVVTGCDDAHWLFCNENMQGSLKDEETYEIGAKESYLSSFQSLKMYFMT